MRPTEEVALGVLEWECPFSPAYLPPLLLSLQLPGMEEGDEGKMWRKKESQALLSFPLPLPFRGAGGVLACASSGKEGSI